jgi:hypothetical protein
MDTTPIAGLWRALALRRNAEVALREHLSLAHVGGHIQEDYD